MLAARPRATPGADIAPGRPPQECDHADARGQERREVGEREVEVVAPVEEEERVEREDPLPAECRVREQRSRQPWQHHDTERGCQQRAEDLDDGHVAEPQGAADRVEDVAQQRDGVAAPLVVVREQREAAAVVEELSRLPVLVRVVVEACRSPTRRGARGRRASRGRSTPASAGTRRILTHRLPDESPTRINGPT